MCVHIKLPSAWKRSCGRHKIILADLDYVLCRVRRDNMAGNDGIPFPETCIHGWIPIARSFYFMQQMYVSDKVTWIPVIQMWW